MAGLLCLCGSGDLADGDFNLSFVSWLIFIEVWCGFVIWEDDGTKLSQNCGVH